MPTFDIDLSSIDTSTTGGFSAYPAGEYRMMISKSEIKDTKSGTGKYVKVEFTHAGDSFRGAKHWENFNIINANPKAVEIAMEQLASLGDACGLGRDFLKTQGNEALEGKVLIVDLKKQPASPGYGDADGMENAARGYAMANGAATLPPPQAAQPDAPVADGADIPF